jgi:hypothetical protein
MADMKIGMGWLGTIFLLIILTLGFTSYNTVMIFRGDSNTLKESTLYIDRRMAEQKVYVDQRSIELKEEYMSIAQRQDIAIHHLIFLTCTTTHTFAECKQEQKELDQLKQESQQLRNE